MPSHERQTFETGPRMIRPTFGVFLAVACVGLAAAQIWAVGRHYSGSHTLAAHEPAARSIFAAVFIIAAFGAVIALLEHRNGRVILTDDSITACCWTGCRTTLPLDQVASVGYLTTDTDQTDFAFHWLYLTTRDGDAVRLAGGPWAAPQSVSLLRHELKDRLELEHEGTEQMRWALLFPATRTRWAIGDSPAEERPPA